MPSSRYERGCGGAQPPHTANRTDRARRPKADLRLEGQRDQRDPVPMSQRDPVPMGEISPTLKWSKKLRLGTKVDMKLTIVLLFGLKLAASTLTFSCEYP